MDKPAVGTLDSEARGTGARFNAGKLEWHQLPMFALEGVVRVLMFGAKKYKPGNYLKGMSWTTVYNSTQRHMAAWQRGEELDPESGLPHLDHAMCNMIFLSAYREVYPEGDDRWPGMHKGGVHAEIEPEKAPGDNYADMDRGMRVGDTVRLRNGSLAVLLPVQKSGGL